MTLSISLWIWIPISLLASLSSPISSVFAVVASVLSLTLTLTFLSTTGPDLLRLVAVPVFAWAAVRDIKTRRVSSQLWIPLTGLGAVLLGWDAWIARNAGGIDWAYEFLLPVGISLGLVVPIAYLFWWFGGFGGADAKALMVLALLFPVFPAYTVGSWTIPLETTEIGAFSFTILTNAVLVAVVIPIVLAVRNGLAGRIAPVMFVGWPIGWDRVPETHGRLLQTPDGLTQGGLDLDALRMYLRWRGLSLAAVREHPDRYRNPATLPADPNPPTDGAVAADGTLSDGGETLEYAEGEAVGDIDGDGDDDVDAATDAAIGTATTAPDATELEDPWGAAAFLEDIEGTAYGTSASQLREGLEVLSAEETVWISPGTPFLVPVFVGLVIALVYGDLLLGALF
ncbi:A24 family peptidase [Natronoglomus mannanivorans]|uniref:Prepilin peptidase n=1 Tax=Natronoglomus mannanivorans TaxID=2979990 RepID=A0AAP2YY52_9EURY|nr:prepilin peptidase [Halobacteria archaeon AArc-xg1-1]